MVASVAATRAAALATSAIAGQASAGVTYTLGDVFQDQLGGATGYPLAGESDGGCDSTNGIGIMACGDAVKLNIEIARNVAQKNGCPFVSSSNLKPVDFIAGQMAITDRKSKPGRRRGSTCTAWSSASCSWSC